MRRATGVITFLAALALVFAAGAPAYADPGDGQGRGQGNPPEHAGAKGNANNANNANANGNGNGAQASGSVGGNASAQDPPGFNGHIKVHDGDSEPEPVVRNEPQVGCTFHIHGFDFDVDADGTWDIQSWPPTGDRSVVLSGTWNADDDGNWRTALLELDSGHHRVNADQTDPAAPGGEKHKMFWVDCPPAAAGGEEVEEVEDQAVLGVQRQRMAGVGPIIEAGVEVEAAVEAGAEQAPAQVAGLEAAPITALPSTSTAPPPMLLSALLMGVGAWMLRRREGDR